MILKPLDSDRALIREVRNESNWSIMDAKNALEDCDWNKEEALKYLQKKRFNQFELRIK